MPRPKTKAGKGFHQVNFGPSMARVHGCYLPCCTLLVGLLMGLSDTAGAEDLFFPDFQARADL